MLLVQCANTSQGLKIFFRLTRDIFQTSHHPIPPHPPVFALVLVRHGAALAAPAVVTVTLRVQARTIDTTVAGSVQTVI